MAGAFFATEPPGKPSGEAPQLHIISVQIWQNTTTGVIKPDALSFNLRHLNISVNFQLTEAF